MSHVEVFYDHEFIPTRNFVNELIMYGHPLHRGKDGKILSDEPSPEPLRCVFLGHETRVKQYGGIRSPPEEIACFTCFDGNFDCFPVVFDAALTTKVTDESLIPGQTYTFPHYKIVDFRLPSERFKMKRVYVFVYNSYESTDPLIAGRRDGGITRVQSDLEESCFRVWYGHDIIKCVMHYESVFRPIKKRAHPRYGNYSYYCVNPNDLHVFRIPFGHACDCTYKYKFRECMTTTFPVKTIIDYPWVRELIVKRLSDKIPGRTWDDLTRGQQKWGVQWWYVINVLPFSLHSQCLPSCLMDDINNYFVNGTT